MPTIREISEFIRDYGHNPRHQQGLIANLFGWHQIWVALDVIDDTELAITAYLESEFPDDLASNIYACTDSSSPCSFSKTQQSTSLRQSDPQWRFSRVMC